MSDPDAVWMMYVTAPDRATAARLAEVLVAERAVACVNILGATESVYRWKGAIERATEVVLVAKTTARRFEEAQRLVVANHPYECPCIVAWPLADGHPAFLGWVRGETGNGAGA